MLVRRYVVKDMPEAVVLIRRDLGKDAVILSSKRVKVKKWLGLWHTKRIEVLAATGDDVPRRVAGSTEAEDKNAVADSTSLMSTAAETAAAVVRPLHSSDQWSELKREMTEIRALLERGTEEITRRTQMEASPRSPESEVLLRLISQGVPREIARDLLDGDSGISEAPMRIIAQLQGLADARPIEAKSRICAFVGPTGVGKTTTVAKIAALHVLGGTRRVGLITTDTYRIAAVEQLRTYAGILHVPLQVVGSPAEFSNALENLSECDLVLIDTAGRSYRSEHQIEELQNLLSYAPIDETFLVMSLTSKPEDLLQLADLFSQMTVDKFLFTKIDETETYGSILALMHRYQKPVSYMTTGQNVPDDIEIASIDKLIRLILGGVA